MVFDFNHIQSLYMEAVMTWFLAFCLNNTWGGGGGGLMMKYQNSWHCYRFTKGHLTFLFVNQSVRLDLFEEMTKF